MATLEHLDEERIKLWARVDQLSNELSSAKVEAEKNLSQKIGEISTSISELRKNLAATDALAKAKAQEDGQVALNAAKAAVKGRSEIDQLKVSAQKAKDDIEKVQKLLAGYGDLDAKAKVFVEKIQQLESQIKDAKEKDAGAQAAWTSINQQKQNVENLNAQVSKDASVVKTVAEDVKKIGEGAQVIKENAQKDLEEKRSALSSLLEEKQRELNKLTKDIERLIPGAINAGLASSFAKRANGQLVLRIVWGILLIGSLLYIAYYSMSLIKPFLNGEMTAVSSIEKQSTIFVLYCRAIALAAMVMLEEFFRRNFNIASRLEEAYAYKAVSFSTYHGFCEELKEIQMPDGKTEAKSVLAGVVLEKLQDEPGKTVFDKEKHEIGPGALFERLVPSKGESVQEKAVDNICSGKFLNNISWQGVAFVAIIAIGICVLTSLILYFKIWKAIPNLA